MTDKTDKNADERIVVPVIEERVVVTKNAVEGRTVSVTSREVTETQKVSAPVVREKVSVERISIGEVVDTVPEVREEGDLTVIPVVEERAVVTKQLVLKEEIHLRRTREEATEDHIVELRRTEVDVAD